jgi:prevent-host-death family protein
MEQVSLDQARRTLGEIVDRARLTGRATLITRQGKPAALVISIDRYREQGEPADAQ